MAALASLDGVASVPAAAAAGAVASPPAAAEAFGLLLQCAQVPAQGPSSQPPAQLLSPTLQRQPTLPQPPARAAVGLPMDSTTDLCLLVDALLGGKPQLTATATTEPVECAADEPSALSTAPASPEQFLQWLAAIKQPALPQPALASADAASPLALDIAQGAITASSPDVLAANAERAAMEIAIASLPSVGSAPPLATGAVALPQPLQPASVIATPSATGNTTLVLDSPDWPQRLGEQIQWRLGEGVQEARIEISPRELGTVKLHLSMDESGLRVHLSAAHAETRNLLHNELPRLREVLQQAGVLLADAQVGHEAPGQQQGRHTASTARHAWLDDDAELLVGTSSGWHQRRGLLDDYA